MQSNYINQAVKGLKKSFDLYSKMAIEAYQNIPVFNVQSTSEWTTIFTSTEGLSGTRELSELETPDTNSLQDGYKVTLVTKRFGNSILVTEEDQLRMADNTEMVNEYLMRQRDNVTRDVVNYFVTELHRFFNEAFDSGSDLLAPDGVELCGAHTYNTGTTFTNSDTAAFSQTAWDSAYEFGGRFQAADGKPYPQDYDTIVVKKGSAADREAQRLFANNISPVQYNDVNIYEGTVRIISTPYITYTNRKYWFAFDLKQMESPLYAGIVKYPSMNAPIVESNQAIRSNVTGFWKQGIVFMPMNVYGSTGAA